MLINWFTVFAQILNFLILVFLLRWFLYKPILKVMQQRQTQLAQRWQEAEQLQEKAKEEIAAYQQQQQDWQQQQADLLTQARLTAEAQRQQLLTQIRQEIADQRAAWQEDLRQEQDTFLQTLRQKVIHQTYAIARQALSDLANADLEEQMMQVFCDRLHHLEDEQKQAIFQALSQTNQPILVLSSREISPNMQQQLTDQLHSQFTITQAIEFTTVPNLLCGIEIKLAGQEIVWSLDTYLQTLEQRLSTALTQETASHHEPHIIAGAGCLHHN